MSEARAAAPVGPILALDSSTATGSVAVGDSAGIRAEIVLNVGAGHSSALLPAVDQALRSAGLRPGDLAAVAVAGGPGSFPGVRIAAATAKGIVQGLEIPLFAYSGLLAAAAQHTGWQGAVWSAFDARRRDVFAAGYRFGAERIETLAAPAAMTVDELIAAARDAGAEPLLTGDALTRHGAELAEASGARIAPLHLAAPRASALIWLALTHPALGRVPDPVTWEPEYLRAAGVERIAAARAAGEER
jgi:tRNA threonylcarbamoyladenosine biosynthesis protein TsaB